MEQRVEWGGCSVFGARSFIMDTESVGIHCDGNEGQRVTVKMGNGHEAQRERVIGGLCHGSRVHAVGIRNAVH